MPQHIENWKCPVCGFNPPGVALTPVRCPCGFIQYQHPLGLGDRVAAVLCRVGVTKSRYRAAKRSIGLLGDCNCDKRQRRLNDLL